jgi:drug/metabolite transporter (DMT)-like permease
MGAASALGQLAGGILISGDVFGLGWRLVFLVNLPIGILAVLAGMRWLDESRAPHSAKLDPIGILLSTAGLACLLGGLVGLHHLGLGWASLLALALVGTNAWFQVLTSRLARTEDPLTMHFYTGWVGALIASLALPFVWTWLRDPGLWIALCFMGFMATVGHFMLILGYQRAPASTLTPYLYAQIAFAMLGGWLVFSHVPDGWSVSGIAMIAFCGAAGAWLTVRESRVMPEPIEV